MINSQLAAQSHSYRIHHILYTRSYKSLYNASIMIELMLNVPLDTKRGRSFWLVLRVKGWARFNVPPNTL